MICAIEDSNGYREDDSGVSHYVLGHGGKEDAILIKEYSGVEVCLIKQPDRISHFTAGKYLAYKAGGIHVELRGNDAVIRHEEQLFYLWEQFVNNFWSMTSQGSRWIVSELVALMNQVSFFTSVDDLQSAAEFMIQIKDCLLGFSCFDKHTSSTRKEYDYPSGMTSKIQSMSQQLTRFGLTGWSATLRALSNLASTKSHCSYLESLSQVLICMAKAKLSAEQYTEAVVLSHRALDVYFSHLLLNSEESDQSYLMDKYNGLVNKQIIMPAQDGGQFMQDLNDMRRLSVYAHGGWRMSKSKSETYVDKTIQMLNTISGSSIACMCPRPFFCDIFQYEPATETYLLTV